MSEPDPTRIAIVDDDTSIVEFVQGITPPEGMTVAEALPLPPGKTMLYLTDDQDPVVNGTWDGHVFTPPADWVPPQPPPDWNPDVQIPTAPDPAPDPLVDDEGAPVLAEQGDQAIEAVGAAPVADTETRVEEPQLSDEERAEIVEMTNELNANPDAVTAPTEEEATNDDA